jgi:hypothetical protein
LAGFEVIIEVEGCEEAARIAPKQGRTVLGKFPEYMNLSEKIGARRFSIPTSVWNKMSPAQQWAANQRFF